MSCHDRTTNSNMHREEGEGEINRRGEGCRNLLGSESEKERMELEDWKGKKEGERKTSSRENTLKGFSSDNTMDEESNLYA